MKLQLQIISNSLIQQIPGIALRIGQYKYLFNVPEQQSRYMRRHCFTYGHGMALFFTKFNTQATGNLLTIILSLAQNQKAFGMRFYINDSMYLYMKYLRRYLGYRMLPFSIYNFQKNIVEFGLKDKSQFNIMMNYSKEKFYSNSSFSNEQLKQILQNVNDASDYIMKQKQSNEIIYKDINIQIHMFKINTVMQNESQVFYNLICKTNRIPFRVSTSKMQSFIQQNNLSGKSQPLKQLFIAGFLTLATGASVSLSDFKQQDQLSPNFLILHYKTAQNIKQIINHTKINSYLFEVKQKQNEMYTNTVIHIIEGSGRLLESQQFRELRIKFGPNVKHIVYNQHCKQLTSQENIIKQLLWFHPYFKFCDLVSKYYPSFMPNLIIKYLQFYDNQNVKNIQCIFSQKSKNSEMGDQGQLINHKNKYELILAPARQKGYYQIKDNRLEASSKQDLFNQTDIKKGFQSERKLYKFLQKFNNQIKNQLLELTKQFNPKITFLGTSSMISTVCRNVSGILIQLHEKNCSILLDCGDGVLNQFIVHFGPSQYEQKLINLKILFLTHFHADHCSGIFRIITHRANLIKKRKFTKNKMFLIMPKNMINWFQVFNLHVERLDQWCQIIFTENISKQDLGKSSVRNQIYNVKTKGLFSNSNNNLSTLQKTRTNFNKQNRKLFKQLNDKKQNKQIQKNYNNKHSLTQNQFSQMFTQCMSSEGIDFNSEYLEQQIKVIKDYENKQNLALQKFNELLKELNIVTFQPVAVYHCKQSYGIIIKHSSNVKISYSGDCRPTQSFKQKSKNSTLLIHQATFTDKYAEKALKVRHSTPKQAIEMQKFIRYRGFSNGSVITALTHFSATCYADKLYQNKADMNLFRQMNRIQYSTNKQLNNNFSKFDQYRIRNTFRAVDHLNFHLSQMHELPNICRKINQFVQ